MKFSKNIDNNQMKERKQYLCPIIIVTLQSMKCVCKFNNSYGTMVQRTNDRHERNEATKKEEKYGRKTETKTKEIKKKENR